MNYKELNVAAPMGVGIDKIVELRNWSPAAGAFLSSAVKIGAISGLTSVILVMMMGQTRIFYAMSKDGLLPWFSHAHPVHGTPIQQRSLQDFLWLFVEALCLSDLSENWLALVHS